MNGAIASLTGSMILAAGFSASASAAELTGWQFDPATQQLQVTVPTGTRPRYFLLAQPARIVLDLPNTQVGSVAAQQSYGGAVRQIRVGQFDATSTRIVIELSPEAELAPGQVELQQGNATTWVLRPLLAGSPIVSEPTSNPPAPTAASPAIAPPAELPAAPIASVAPVSSPANLPPLEPNAVEIPVEPSAAASLPPLEPNAVEIPVAPAAAEPASESGEAVPPVAAPSAEPATPTANAAAGQFEAEATVIAPIETSVLPSESATSTVTLNSAPTPAAELPPRPAEPNFPARNPILLPPAIEPPSQPQPSQPIPSPAPSVQVPPLTPRSQAATSAPVELPPALSSPAPASQVTVPPLNPTRPPASSSAAPARSVEFGESLPAAPALNARRSSVLMPAGTVLSLRYPREAAIAVESGRPRQEVLVVQTAVRNAAGETVLPAGAQVIGRFEVDRSGSRFVAQAVAIEGRNIRLNGTSAAAGSDRLVAEDDLLVHSALGALVLTLLGGFSGLGLIGGAAAGAATTYLSPPDPVTIQPNQVFEVRLTEDVPQ